MHPQPSDAAPLPEPVSHATSVAPSVSAALTRRRRLRSAAVPIALFFVAVMAGSGLFVAGFALGSQRATTAGTPAELEREFQPFWEAFDAITQQYVGELDRKALIEGAIGGMFEALNDPYSGYMTSEEYRSSLEGLSGQFEGIGAEIGTEAVDDTGACAPISPTCHMVIIAPLEGSPAEEAGLKAGDVVTAIDGGSTDGLTLDDAVAKVRGPRGTTVTLSVQRPGASAPLEIAITRDVIVVRDVTTRTLADGEIGYLRIAHFSSNVGSDFRAALEGQLDEGIRSFILDLRGDPGGFVPEAVSVASQFVPEGEPVFWEEYAGGKQKESEATAAGLATESSIRLVVLIDQGTASASEIVAAALQENGRATLVGATTFGKGTVQNWQLLSGDSGGFRLTVAKWLTPEKHWINGAGIEPDVAVSAEGAPPDADPALERAVEILTAAAAAGPAVDTPGSLPVSFRPDERR